MNDEKPTLIIVPRGRLDGSEGGIRWIYLLRTHTRKMSHRREKQYMNCLWHEELIGGSRCGDDIEQAKQQAYAIMAEIKFTAYDYDVEVIDWILYLK